jgi:hypothetical protein
VLTLNLILSVLLLAIIANLLYKRYQLKKEEKVLKAVGVELDKTLDTLKDIVRKKGSNKVFDKHFLLDAEMLSTLITVIVAKYGNMQLRLQDFDNLRDGEYVSVYVDVEEENLILTTDRTFGKDSALGIVNLGTPDDGTFH